MASGVEFEEDKFTFGKPAGNTVSAPSGMPNLGYGRPQLPSNTPKMAQWLMKHGIKSSASAQAILIALVIFNIIVTFVVVKFFIF